MGLSHPVVQGCMPAQKHCVPFSKLASTRSWVGLNLVTRLVMMMIAFITIKSSLVPLIEGLCAQIYFRFEISVVCSHLLLFFFVKEKIC